MSRSRCHRGQAAPHLQKHQLQKNGGQHAGPSVQPWCKNNTHTHILKRLAVHSTYRLHSHCVAWNLCALQNGIQEIPLSQVNFHYELFIRQPVEVVRSRRVICCRFKSLFDICWRNGNQELLCFRVIINNAASGAVRRRTVNSCCHTGALVRVTLDCDPGRMLFNKNTESFYFELHYFFPGITKLFVDRIIISYSWPERLNQ